MSTKTIHIEEFDIPGAIINGENFELLCEFEAKDKTFQRVYIKDEGIDVIIKVSPEKAVTGLFSIEGGRLKQLFDYIEASILKKDGLICYEAELFPRFLEKATNLGGRYSILNHDVSVSTPERKIAFFNLLRNLHPQPSLNKSLQQQIQEHTVSVEKGVRESIFLNKDAPEEDTFSKPLLSNIILNATDCHDNNHQNSISTRSKENMEH